MQATAATGAPNKMALILGATHYLYYVTVVVAIGRCERHRTDGMVCAPIRDTYLSDVRV